MPYLSCPACRRTHFAASAPARATTCPTCPRAVPLFASDTLADARAELESLPRSEPAPARFRRAV